MPAKYSITSTVVDGEPEYRVVTADGKIVYVDADKRVALDVKGDLEAFESISVYDD